LNDAYKFISLSGKCDVICSVKFQLHSYGGSTAETTLYQVYIYILNKEVPVLS